MRKLLILLCCLAAITDTFAEEVRYVRDMLWVPLRSGQSNAYRIVHKGLESGTRVTVLEVNEESEYSLVRTRSGIEGWIQTQYLMDQPAARDLLKQAQSNLEQLRKENSQLKDQLGGLQGDFRETASASEALQQRNAALSAELEEIKAISANAIQLNSDNSRLLEENQALKNRIDILAADNQRLDDKLDNDAFINGAFAVLIGVMITLVVPRLWPRKRSEWV